MFATYFGGTTLRPTSGSNGLSRAKGTYWRTDYSWNSHPNGRSKTRRVTGAARNRYSSGAQDCLPNRLSFRQIAQGTERRATILPSNSERRTKAVCTVGPAGEELGVHRLSDCRHDALDRGDRQVLEGVGRRQWDMWCRDSHDRPVEVVEGLLAHDGSQLAAPTA